MNGEDQPERRIRRHWEERLDRLDKYLQELKRETQNNGQREQRNGDGRPGDRDQPGPERAS
jgi:hypothetical protein